MDDMDGMTDLEILESTLVSAERLRRLAECTAASARAQVREEFQIEHPHYTPAPDQGFSFWERWYVANLKLHGTEGFDERFPYRAEIIASAASREMRLLGLQDLAYHVTVYQRTGSQAEPPVHVVVNALNEWYDRTYGPKPAKGNLK